MADEPRLKAVVATDEVDHETVLGVAEDLRRPCGADLFVVTDGSGRLLADVADPRASGASLADNPEVRAALDGGEASGVWSDGRRAYQVQARRVAFGATTVGVVVIGFALDDRVASTVNAQTGARVAILLDGKEAAAAPRDEPSLAPSLATLTLDGAPAEISTGDARWLARAGVFPGSRPEQHLRFAVARSLDDALAPARRLRRILYMVLAASLVLAVALALGLARRLARPLDQLVAFTRAIAGGKLEARAAVDGPLEVRALGAAMNGMVGELLASRRELLAKERLEQELAIATRIQTSILPKTTTAGGLEIAARMVPASEVGGDYYDVIPVESGCWIGIGDVAGHGLTAGLVMLMIQSGVAALVRRDPSARPRDLLRALNEVLFDNIRHRLDRDEHVTLTLFRYRSDGELTFAGAHEDLVIIHADGSVEQLPTPGPWLGAMRDVDQVAVDSTITLRGGDLLILYTDGLIEAMNGASEQFGIDRLCEAAAALRDRPVAEIRDRLLATVERWTDQRTDDVTILILRQLG